MVFFGLGNPGLEYHDTKHNLGFQVIDAYVFNHRREIVESRFLPMLYHFWKSRTRNGNDVIFLKPLTYMNRSGEAYMHAKKKFGFEDTESVVIYDDVALPLGAVRIRVKGSDGGHKGMRSILQAVGHDEIVRIRIGIGPKPDTIDLSDYVLAPLKTIERRKISDAIDRVSEAMDRMIYERIEIVMNDCNRVSREDHGIL
jgi:PTH1 family peptidyl-tRNA hydrolase